MQGGQNIIQQLSRHRTILTALMSYQNYNQKAKQINLRDSTRPWALALKFKAGEMQLWIEINENPTTPLTREELQTHMVATLAEYTGEARQVS